jgi:membrane protease YdiL (CAAX protease family)
LGRTGALSSQATAWRGRGRWLALATLGPLAMFLMAVVVARLVGGQWPALDRFGASTEYPALPIVTYWLANLVFYGFGEEVGWRGYLQPTLEQRCPVLGAAAILSVIWALWPLPLFERRWASLATRPPTPSSRPPSTIIVVRIATDDHPPNPGDTERV